MKTRKTVLGSLALLLMLLSFSTAALAPALKFTFKDVVVPKAIETDSYAVNNAGVIAGDYIDSKGTQYGLILNGKTVTKYTYSKCPSTTTNQTAAFGINTASAVVGWCLNSSSVPVGFMYAKGKFAAIAGPAGNTGVEANGINDKGAIVGAYFDSAGVEHGFLYANKKYTTMDPKGSTATAAWSINNAGVIGIYGINSSGDYISFTTKDNGKTYKAFGYPKAGPLGTAIHGVNNKGDIDGTYFDANSAAHGVLLHGGKYYSFDDPKASNSTRADGLNDKLIIVGRYSPSDGTNHGFEATAK
jgi:probable HAF family extracellular repeat protein